MERQIKLWGVRAHSSAYVEDFRSGGYTAIDYDIAERIPEVALRRHIAELYQKYHPEVESPLSVGQHTRQIMRFVFEISTGDYILMPSSNPDYLYFGVVLDEPYLFISDPKDNCPFRHRRAVEWHAKPILRTRLSTAFQRELRTSLSVFPISHAAEFFAISAIQKEALLKDEQTSDPIQFLLGRILSLDDSEFCLLVEELLSAVGFEDCQIVRIDADKTVLMTAHLSVMNIVSNHIYIQWKRRKTSDLVTANTILQLRATIPLNAQGAFITLGEFKEEAIQRANEPGFPRIGLINGQHFVGLLADYWPQFSIEFHEKLGLKQGLIPMQPVFKA